MNNRLSRPLIVLVAITAASLPAACSESEGSPPEPAEAAKGLARLETSSDTGDMWGQFYLGILKTYGKEDLPDSLGLVLSSAEHVGGPKRMYEGYRNALFAESLAPAPLDGIDLLKSSSSAGCGAASYALAVIHGIDPYDFWDAETSIENYREHLNLAHEQGLSTATGALGAHYVRGEHGYQRDVVRGRELLLSSYDQGDAWAAFALAHAYWNGLFGAVNKPRALKYYEESGRRGYAFAYVELGRYYRDEGDVERSIGYFERAIAMGSDVATLGLARALFDLYPSKQRDVGRAKKLLVGLVERKCSESGAAAAVLAMITESEGRTADRQRWLETAVEFNEPGAHFDLAWMHIHAANLQTYGDKDGNERGVFHYSDLPQDLVEKAYRHFLAASQEPNGWAMRHVALIIAAGKSGEYDYGSPRLPSPSFAFSPEERVVMNAAANWMCRARAHAVGYEDEALLRLCDDWLSEWGYSCR